MTGAVNNSIFPGLIGSQWYYTFIPETIYPERNNLYPVAIMIICCIFHVFVLVGEPEIQKLEKVAGK